MKFNKSTFNIAFSGIMLSFILLFQYLEKFTPLVPFVMNINFSLVFLVLVFFMTNWKYGIFVLFARFLISPFVGSNTILMGFLGAFASMLAAMIFIGLLFLAKWLKLIHSKKWKFVISVSLATIISTILMTFINGILIFPLYTWVFSGEWIYASKEVYWGISNYWLMICGIYITGNLIIYSIASMILVSCLQYVKPHLNFQN